MKKICVLAECVEREITMKRFDNQLDILDATTYQVKRTEPVPDEGS